MAGDPYKELGVSKGASADEVKKAYRKLAKELHPDKNPGDKITEDKFKRVTAAFDILGDKEKRAKYDAGQIDGDGNEQYRGFGGGGRAGGSPFGQGGNPFGQGGGPGGGPTSKASIWTTCSACSAAAGVSAARGTSPRAVRT